MAIQARWGKGLSEGRTDKEIMAKIARGYRHSVADLLKVYLDPAPFEGISTPTTSKALGRSGAPPPKKN
ncbi:hypothetical protein Tco_0985311 [Tanacetum coccineum]